MQDQFNMKKDADVVVQNEQQECQTTKQKSKTPTHLTIQQQNQNNKIKLNPNAKQARKSSRSPQQKTFKKLYKQQKKVRSLEQEYRQLQEEVREIKQLVKLQLQLIQHNSKNFDSQIQVENKSSQEKSKVTLPSESQQKKPLQKLQHCIGQLFSYHSTIETVNSNYLLLSQVNKEEESQHIFHINNLQERVRQLRFLLNGKQDLLAYELATFDKNTPNDQFIGEEPQKILIDYHMPKKDSLNSKNNMESEFKFVQKVIKEMTKLKQTVNKLEKQVQSYNICQPKNSMDNEEGESQIEPKKTFDRDYVIEKDENNQVNYAYTSRTSRNQNINQNSNNKNSTPVKPFAEHNLNTVNSPKQMKTPLKSAVSQFLPLGNYKQSLIYRVGKLHQIQQQRSRQLKKTYQQLLKQSQAQSLLKKTLVSDYEIKRDIYTYKKNQRAHQQIFYILKDLQKQITQKSEEKSNQILKQDIIEENIELKASKIQQLNVQPQQLQMTSNRFETSQGFKTVNSFKDQNLDHSPSKSINVFKQRIHNIIQHQNQNSDQKTTQKAKIQPEKSQNRQNKSLKTQQNQNSQNENFEKVNRDQMNDRTNVNEEVILIDSQTTQNAPCVSLQSVPQNRVFENITNNQKHSKSKSIHNPFLKLKILTDEETLKRKHFSHEQNFNRFQQKLIEKKISSESRPHFKGNKQNEGFSQQNNEVQQEKHEQAQIPQRQLNFESQTQPQAQNQNICNPYRKAISRRRKEKTIKQSQQKKQTIIQTVET